MKTTLAVLAVSALAVAPLQAQTVMKGDFILQHQIADVLLEFTKLAKAGQPEEAAKLQSKRAVKRRADRTPVDRKESDAFVKDFLPAPAALEESIRKNGSLTVEGDKATLQISVSTSAKNPDGSVTASAEAMAFAFVREDDDWRLDQ